MGWAIAGWVLSFFVIAGLALRWGVFLRQQKLHLPFRSILALTWAGQFFNSVLPGSTGGDVIKMYQLCRIAPDRKAGAVASVLADRLSALVALLVMAGVGFVLEPAPLRFVIGKSPSGRFTALALLVFAIIAASGAWLLFRLTRTTHWPDRLRRTIAAAKTNLTLSRETLIALAGAFALHFLNFFTIYLFARALGIAITYSQILLMMPVVLFVVLLPITINGHGIRELLLIGYFTHLGVTLSGVQVSGVQEVAVALSLVLVANDLVWSLPGGLWYLSRFKMRGTREE